MMISVCVGFEVLTSVFFGYIYISPKINIYIFFFLKGTFVVVVAFYVTTLHDEHCVIADQAQRFHISLGQNDTNDAYFT